MLAPELFRRFGFHVEPGFLDAATCVRLRQAAAAAAPAFGTVMRGEEAVVDEERRRTLVVRPAESAVADLERRLETLRPVLTRHFGLGAGTTWEPPRCLRYRPGDFFVVHRDRSEARLVRRRRVSIVVFLNEPSADPGPDTFGGGELIFYPALDDPRLRHVGFPIRAAAGLLVAFPADALHEVTPVTHGERFTAVAWLCDPDGAGAGRSGAPAEGSAGGS